MKKDVLSPKSEKFGTFDGVFIRNTQGKKIYWIDDDNDVMAPLEYEGEDLKLFNKGGWALIGKLLEGKCISNEGEMIFQIRD